MSHTIEANGHILIGNSDFSGDVTIRWLDDAGVRREATMPGPVFLALAKMVARDEIIRLFKRTMDEWVEGR